jgi:hypothetical protein
MVWVWFGFPVRVVWAQKRGLRFQSRDAVLLVFGTFQSFALSIDLKEVQNVRRK